LEQFLLLDLAVEFCLTLIGWQREVGVDAGLHRVAEDIAALPASLTPHVFGQGIDLLANLAHGCHGSLGLVERLRAAVGHELLLGVGLQFLDLGAAGIRCEPDIARRPETPEGPRPAGSAPSERPSAPARRCRRALKNRRNASMQCS
jgi:hypothetical protein